MEGPVDRTQCTGRPARLTALDLMRGLVMVLMAVDHAGATFDADHLATDSSAMATPGGELPLGHFLTRWITHLCAPTFVFLAGASLALSLGRGGSRRDMALRGLLIIVLEVTVVSASWASLHGPMITLQVLYAIGLSMIAMSVLSRLPSGALLALALAWLVAGEWLTMQGWNGAFGGNSWTPSLLFGMGFFPAAVSLPGLGSLPLIVLYPLLPWLAMMMLGWVFGRHCQRCREQNRSAAPTLLVWGTAGLLLFTVLRGMGGYGDMGLPREDGSLAQWLRVSKYPPSLTFVALELGLMALILGGLMRWYDRRGAPTSDQSPLLVFGQTALFFYLLHVPLLTLSGLAFPGLRSGGCGGLLATWIGAAAVLAVLYLPCRAWRSYKRAHPRGPARFI